jgi:hypothetical protein
MELSITASGVRLIVPEFGLNGGTAIDDIEVYAAPEPSGLALFAIAMVPLIEARRRLSGS